MRQNNNEIISKEQYEYIKNNIIASFNGALVRLSINNQKSDINETLTNIFSFYLKHNLNTIFQSNVILDITKEVYENPELSSLIVEQSVLFSLYISNNHVTSSHLQEMVINSYQNLIPVRTDRSLIPEEVYNELKIDPSFVREVVESNFWYVVFYLTVVFISETDYFNSFIESKTTGV